MIERVDDDVMCNRTRPRILAATGLLFALFVACGGDDEPRGGVTLDSAIWPSVPLPWSTLRAPEAAEHLRAAEVGSQLVDAGRLGAEGFLESFPVRSPLDGLATVLVFRGGWEDLVGAGRGDLHDLAEELVLLTVEWESAGAAVRGLHLDLEGVPADSDAAARAISRIEGELPDRLRLSLQVPPELLSLPEGLAGITREADLLIGSVYGQSWRSTDVPALWDLEEAIARARSIDALGRPFLAALATEGRIFEPGTGAVVARGLGPEVLRSGGTEVEGAFVYEGFHRQLLDLTPRREIDGLGADDEPVPLVAGRTVRLARPTAGHLAAVVAALEREELGSLEGIVWRGGGGGENAAGLSVDRLSWALGGSVDPALTLRVARDEAAGALRVVLENAGDPTAWADRTYNYVEVDLEGAVFGEVDLGGFSRIELSMREVPPGVSPMEQLRRADRLRLHFVHLEPGERTESGAIEIRGAAGWSARVSATVLAATGDVVTVPESLSEDGAEVEDSAADATEAVTAESE